MKKIVCIFVFFILLSPIKASDWFDSVIVRPDNGYVSYIDSTSPREKAPMSIRERCSKYYFNNESGRNQIFKISLGATAIYVVRYSGIDYEDYYFFAANPLSETLSKKPFVINGKWCADNESGFDVPLLKDQMIEVSGNSIFLRERVHNGNSYNAVLLYCLQCNTELEFSINYCVEETSLCFTPEMERNDYLIISRELDDSLKVDCFVENSQGRRQLIGAFSLSPDGAVSNINVVDFDFQRVIVTTSGIKPHIFSKRGSSYYARKNI